MYVYVCMQCSVCIYMYVYLTKCDKRCMIRVSAIYACIYVYVYAYIYMYVYIQECMYMYVYICMYTYICIYVYISM